MLAVLGRTPSGRGLLVYVRHADGLDWTIVGARPMTLGELDEYEEWETQS